MTYYDEPVPTDPEPTDPRIALLQRVVEMERMHRSMEMEQKRIAEKSTALYRELQQTRSELGTLLGFRGDEYATAAEKAAAR